MNEIIRFGSALAKATVPVCGVDGRGGPRTHRARPRCFEAWFQVAVFPPSDRDAVELEPLHLEHHRLRGGTQRITAPVAAKPGMVGVDPYRLMIDRMRDDNLLRLTDDDPLPLPADGLLPPTVQ